MDRSGEGDRLTLEVTDLGHDGEGVARHRGLVVFIPGALPGERVVAELVERKRHFARARLLEVERPAPERVTPPCAVYGECGGCQLQHLRYEEQLAWKAAYVRECLRRIGGLHDVPVQACLGMDHPWGYRNKAQYPVARVDGGVVLGFYRKGSHEVVAATGCLVQHPLSRQAAEAARQAVADLGIPPYDESTHQGVIRHVLCRVSFSSQRVLVTFVTRTPRIPREAALVETLRTSVPNLAGITQNINPRPGNVILGERNRLLWGEDVLCERILDLELCYSAPAFFQVNPVQTEVLYRQVLAYAALKGDEHVVDAYCGIGSITLPLARRAGRVTGIEVVEAAVRDARRNAARNGIPNVTFLAGEAEAILPERVAAGERPDVVVVDPPRKGCGRPLLDAILAVRPARVVYVSCNPATLARDLRILVDGGYQVREVQPVDMFPQTAHVEAVALLTRDEPT